MALSLRRWRPRHLLLAWSGYWLALALVGPPALAIARLPASPPDTRTVAANFDDSRIQLTVTQSGATVWSGTTSVAELTLWLTGPPLLLWLAWVLLRRPRTAADDDITPPRGVAPAGAPGALGVGDDPLLQRLGGARGAARTPVRGRGE